MPVGVNLDHGELDHLVDVLQAHVRHVGSRESALLLRKLKRVQMAPTCEYPPAEGPVRRRVIRTPPQRADLDEAPAQSAAGS